MPKKKRKNREHEQDALNTLWNWVCLGACGSTKDHDRWLKALDEMNTELKRYYKEGCRCEKV